MVLSSAQTNTFFEYLAHMAFPRPTVVYLQQEGILIVNDISNFNKTTIKQLAVKLRFPAGHVKHPNRPDNLDAMIPTSTFVFGARSRTRLTIAAKLVRYYDTVDCDITLSNMEWYQTVNNIQVQWKALDYKKNKDKPDIPAIKKTLPVIKWTKEFRDYLHHHVGARMIPLAYVMRSDIDVPLIGEIATGKPHSEEHGAIEDELIFRAPHTHLLYCEDTAVGYYLLEEATRATSYAASIKPCQSAKNSRDAWLALTSQYDGKDKWEEDIKRQNQLLHMRKWKGQSNYTLKRFIAEHRNSFVSIQASLEHVHL